MARRDTEQPVQLPGGSRQGGNWPVPARKPVL